MKKILYLILPIFFVACEKNDDLYSNLKGTWVEKSLRRDTLIFDSPDFNFSVNWFELRRGVMLSSGPYEYILKQDSISIQWMLSSCICWKSYYFRMNPRNNELLIGKFYDSEELEDDMLNFVKTW